MGKLAKFDYPGKEGGWPPAASRIGDAGQRRSRREEFHEVRSRRRHAKPGGEVGVSVSSALQVKSTANGRSYTAWQADDRRCGIEFCPIALESIRFECSRSMNGVGGMGIGGVLLGAKTGDSIRVLDWRPIPCDHSRGPAFRLSAHDLSGLSSFLEGLRPHRANDMQIVGWFVSHPRGGFSLGEEEITLHQRFFESSRIVLVIRPERMGEAEVAVHDGLSGRMDPVFNVDPLPASQRAEFLRVAQTSLAAVSKRPQSVSRWRPAIWLSVVLALGAAVTGGLLARPQRLQPLMISAAQAPIEMLSLHAASRGGRLVISWNGGAEVVRFATQVTFEIHDGSEIIRRDLDQTEARTGIQFYRPRTGEVTVILQLRTANGQVFEENTTYLSRGKRRIPTTGVTPDMVPPVEGSTGR